MDRLKAFENLARRARAETPPSTDVGVGAIVRAMRRQREAQPAISLAWPAIVSALAASLLLALSYSSTAKTTANATSTATADTVTPLFSSASVEMP